MRSGGITHWGVALLAFSVPLGRGLAAQAASPVPRMVVSLPGPIAPPNVPTGEIVREIDDPHTGDRWLLMLDSRHPGGPGLLLLVAEGRTELRQAGRGAETPAPIVHAGDRVIVEEHNAVVDLRLEAVAMGPAAPGTGFNARLAIGGNIVRAIALAPGRAAFPEQRGGLR